MSLKLYEKWVLAGISAVVLFVLGAMLLTGGWATYFEPRRTAAQPQLSGASLVDVRDLNTAQTLAQLAATPSEKQFAEDALRLGDHAVDLNFSAALKDAASNPPPSNPQTVAIAKREKAAEDVVETDNDRITELTRRLSVAPKDSKDETQDQLALQQAQLALDQDALQDAQQDLIRAGGDNQAQIQAILDEHNASEAHSTGSAGSVGADASSIELSRSRNIEDEVAGWLSLRSKESQLLQAQQQAIIRGNALNTSHDTLEKKLASESQQNTASHPELSGAAGASNAPSAKGAALALIHQMTQDQKDLSSFDTRIETETQLATVYANWAKLVESRKQIFLRRFLYSFLSILLITLVVLILNHWVRRLFANVSLERRQLHTLRALVLFVVQMLGMVIIFVIIFGIPTNFATAIGLVGAGLAVGLKDFIVGFFGWFILMGKDGIRPGDWVEINGVGGEVLEVGIFQTVLLETGALTDAGRPTGRKVSFINSYAVEGHYFNFSTTGQWLWEEIEIQIPDNVEPYGMAESIQKIAENETSANARLAEDDWNRGKLSSLRQSFSANPSLSLRPTATGVSVLVRYIARVSERHEVRARIYRAVVELLHNTKETEGAPAPASGSATGTVPLLPPTPLPSAPPPPPTPPLPPQLPQQSLDPAKGLP